VTTQTHEPHGTTFMRKLKGRKLQFAIGGPTLAEIQRMCIAGHEDVFVWQGDNRQEVVFRKLADGSIETLSDRFIP